jgi:hypothetical protein
MIDTAGTMYVADLDQVWAFNPNGTTKWVRSYGGDSRTGTFTADGKLLIMTQGLTSVSSSLIYIIDPATGAGVIPPTSVQTLGGYTTPVVSTNTPAVDPTTGDIVNSIDLPADPVTGLATGEYFSFKWNPQSKTLTPNWHFPIPGHSLSSPTIAANGTVFAHDGVDTTNAIKRDGSRLWSYNVGGLSAASHAYDPVTGNVYIITGSVTNNSPLGIFALDCNGKLLWKNNSLGTPLPTNIPVLSQNGHIYFVGILNPTSTLYFFTLDALTGQILGQQNFSSISGSLNTFNDAGDAFITAFQPQSQYNTFTNNLPPKAIVGVQKYAAAAPSVCGQTAPKSSP